MSVLDRQRLRVFISYSSRDNSTVRELYQKLLAESWINPRLENGRLDNEQNSILNMLKRQIIFLSQEGESRAEKLIEAAKAIIVCLARESIRKDGTFQEEIKKILAMSEQKPGGTVLIIPLRLDDCQIPGRLAKWQSLDYFPLEARETAYRRLLQSLQARYTEVSTASNQPASSMQEDVHRITAPKHKIDHHKALISRQVSQASANGIDFVLARLQWDKDNIGFSLHAEPNSFTNDGMQTTDFLAFLGFKREKCSFVPRIECYAIWMDPEFDITGFSQKFNEAFDLFAKAARLLESCAIFLEQPEGWGYFTGRSSSRKSNKSRFGFSPDGHTANKTEKIRQNEDDHFIYKLSWIESPQEKGWVIHYRPKETINHNLSSALTFLGLNTFKKCPYFDFEECYWMYIQHENRGDSLFESNENFVQDSFDAHQKSFSQAVEMLIKSNDLVLPFGLHFL